MIELLPVGEGVSTATLDALARRLARVFGDSCHVCEAALNPDFAFEPVRQQFHSTAILGRMAGAVGTNRILGVINADLYVPIFKFVFGEAQLKGRCALVSTFRLQESFYGLMPNPRLEEARLLKEAVHELGHTFGLRHCNDWHCAMASSHTIDRLDLKDTDLCRDCRCGL